MDNNVKSSLEKGQSLFVVDLNTVSLFNEEAVYEIANNETRYKKTPFLFLIASVNRNKTIEWADKNYKYNSKTTKGAWDVYKFDCI